jgi:hypothetical protein
MASRSNTALHAAVILLILLVVVLGVTTYVFWSSNSQAQGELADAKADVASYESARVNVENAYHLLKVVVGQQSKYNQTELDGMRERLTTGDAALAAEIEAIETKFQQDMQSFPASYADVKDYTTLHVVLFQALKDVNSQLADTQDRERQLNADITQVRNTEQTKVTQAEAARQQAFNEKTAAEAQAADQYSKLQDMNRTLITDTGKTVADYKLKLDQSQLEVNSLKANVGLLEQQVASQGTKLRAMTTTKFARADGRIVHVSQEQRRVWIDLGSKDGLRRQQTFTVYGSGEIDFENAKPKGTIEVTAITGPSMAEARIVTDNISDPLLTDDVVFTPVWQPGQRLHFALAGLLDIDGDRKSDSDRIKALIAANGGIIDAEVSEVGARSGKLTIETRYLVVGERPTDTSDPMAVSAYTTMVSEADNYGVEKISVDKLLSLMGYRPEVITTPLGGTAPGGGFRKRDAYAPTP